MDNNKPWINNPNRIPKSGDILLLKDVHTSIYGSSHCGIPSYIWDRMKSLGKIRIASVASASTPRFTTMYYAPAGDIWELVLCNDCWSSGRPIWEDELPTTPLQVSNTPCCPKCGTPDYCDVLLWNPCVNKMCVNNNRK